MKKLIPDPYSRSAVQDASECIMLSHHGSTRVKYAEASVSRNAASDALFVDALVKKPNELVFPSM